MRLVLLAALLLACSDGAPPTRLARPAPRPPIREPTLVPAELEAAPVRPVALAPIELAPPVLRGPKQIDRFVQDEAKVDLLFVVDNSGSLTNERRRLAEEMRRFIDALLAKGTSFRLGVTSTDLSPATGDGGRLRGVPSYLDEQTPDPEASFLARVTFANERAVTLEEGLAAAAAALTPPLSLGANAGFLRPEASLAILILSDEEDGSLGSVEHYARLFRGLKGPGRERDVSISSIVGDVPDGCVPPGEEGLFGAEAPAGERYVALTAATGGLFESICTLDFRPFVDELADRLSGLIRFFPLSLPASPASIVVSIDGRATRRFVYDAGRRAIVIDPPPPPRAEIRIEYEVALD